MSFSNYSGVGIESESPCINAYSGTPLGPTILSITVIGVCNSVASSYFRYISGRHALALSDC